MRLVAIILMMVWPSICTAGAWPREEGRVFLSFSTTSRAQVIPHATQIDALAHSSEYNLYLEYGLSQRVTLGFDAMMTENASFGRAFLFGRLALGSLETPNRYAATFAIGQFIDTVIDTDHLDAEYMTLTRLGFHYGRGLSKGWLGADFFATQHENGTSLKLDATWGLKPWDKWMFIAQVQSGQPAEGDSYANFAPSAVWKLNDRYSIEVGVVQPLLDDGDIALKLGSWTEF